ncbi:cohesin domain-containing protein [Clostridium sp. JS66]|uniref:cohesin domain-containing protein n=1 Tax=Clostridium sp. JS66 TaxID=3064705 RepID=UPI00298DDBCF|nr:cohesin domain-containing protein [Clostridium sp. JS66]WPC40936.1 cohesin domain-containing protein [Clostridium sp. JS66]
MSKFKNLISKIVIVFAMALIVGVLGSNNVKADDVYTDNLIPIIQQDGNNRLYSTLPEGRAFCSGGAINGASSEVVSVFDRKDETFSNMGLPATAGYIFKSPQKIGKYVLTAVKYSGGNCYYPGQWYFEGSNDTTTGTDGTWKIIDSRTYKFSWDGKGNRNEYIVNNETYYKAYRLRVVASAGDYGVMIQGLEMMGKIEASKTILNVEPEKAKIHLNETVSANLTIDNIKDIAAEDVRIKYDNTKLQFLGATEVDGIKLVKNDAKDGELRLILASKGVTNVVEAKKALLKLNFKGIAAGDALVDVTKGRVSDGITMEKDLTDDQCGQATITIDNEALTDVNKDGQFTLLDLAIDGRHYSEDPASLTQYNTDIVVNKAIDDDDLTKIGEYMLANPNYSPNNVK